MHREFVNLPGRVVVTCLSIHLDIPLIHFACNANNHYCENITDAQSTLITTSEHCEQKMMVFLVQLKCIRVQCMCTKKLLFV